MSKLQELILNYEYDNEDNYVGETINPIIYQDKYEYYIKQNEYSENLLNIVMTI